MRSMTGYAKVVETVGDYEISVEVKTLNSKYLSTSFSLPSYLSGCETALNELVTNLMKRGKVNVRVYVKFLKPPSIDIDMGVAKAYYDALEELASSLGIPEPVSLDVLMRFKEILRFDLPEEEIERLCGSVKTVVGKALEKAVKEREIEGEKLKRVLSEFLDGIEEKLRRIEGKARDMLEHYSKLLRENVERIIPDDVIVDRNILETAIAVLAERADITEEIDRIKSHVSRARELLESDGSVGPNLDFLAQELLREFNTILSKAKIVEIADAALEGKVLVNSFREQVQNVE